MNRGSSNVLPESKVSNRQDNRHKAQRNPCFSHAPKSRDDIPDVALATKVLAIFIGLLGKITLPLAGGNQ
jgi:hypothetical protein